LLGKACPGLVFLVEVFSERRHLTALERGDLDRAPALGGPDHGAEHELENGFLGTALPNSLSYMAYEHLPVGVMAICIALGPMATLLIALPLGIVQPDHRRLIGLGLGAVAVLLIALPESGLPEPGQAAWVALPVIISLAYATENVYIAIARPPGLYQ
jgi:drug/metabolite transporter (DMT)-like permease